MKAILVDDEKDSLKILEALIANCAPEVEVIASCYEPKDAVAKIKTLKPQIVFLDVEMRGLTGFDLLNQIPAKDFEVIFTTSHERFALKALKAGAIDYLVKPVQAEDLKEAVRKVLAKQTNNSSSLQQFEMLMNYFKPQKPKVRRVALTASDHLVFVDTNDIVYCESDSNYTTFFLTRGDKVVISKTLKDVEEILEGDDFFRIHASYLINMKHVSKFTRGDGGYVVMSNNQQLTVSRKKKDEFFEMFSKL
jgi:two-component system, LytTR family, response regulator